MPLTDLRTEHMTVPLGVWTSEPRLSWQVRGNVPGVQATRYELEVTDEANGEVLWRSRQSPPRGLPQVEYAGKPLESAHRYRWRVRAEIGGAWTPWSQSHFETSLLTRSDWIAPFLEPEQQPITPDGLRRENGDWLPPAPAGPMEHRLHPVKYIRQQFAVSGCVRRARLYATARGVYDAEINGTPIGDELLAPGYESYDKSLSFQTYDVTDALAQGENVIGFRVADGWYGGRIDFTGSSAQYGDRLQVGWQLHLDYADRTEIVIASAEARSSTEGPIRYADIFIGERHDARREMTGWSSPGFDASAWRCVTVVAAPKALHPFVGEPVRRTEELEAVRIIRTPAGEDVIDFGQVIAGRVRMRVQGAAGTDIELQHSETLDADGNFFLNIGGLNKDQTDSYVLAGDPNGETWEPAFTFHGFRFVRVSGYPGAVRAADFTAVTIGSDLAVTGGLRTSDPALTRLHENVVWSQRANFLAIPTDCPQRERVGWTGDLQVFAPSATRNRDVRLFVERWLDNLRLDQQPDGLVPVIVPSPPYMTSLADDLRNDPLLSIQAAAGWGDAVVLVPWTLYQRYGDPHVLRQNYGAMRAWVDRQIRVAETELPRRLEAVELTPQQRHRQSLLWNSEPNFGDWNAPSTKRTDPSLEYMLSVASTTGEIIGAMFHFRVLEVLASVAAVLERTDHENTYRQRADAVRIAFAEEYLDGDGGLWAPRQGTYVLALAFGLIPAQQHAAAVERLVALVHDADDHLDTGFLSVPYLLDVLWDNGHRDLARTVLEQRSSPSWLYAVDRGATTIWEEWSAVGVDGSVGQASLNHYAFGCVDDWLYRRVVGIDALEPGYRHVLIEPDFEVDLEWAEGWHNSPYGRIHVRWDRDAESPGSVSIAVRLPFGTTGEFRVTTPLGVETRELDSGETRFRINDERVLQ